MASIADRIDSSTPEFIEQNGHRTAITSSHGIQLANRLADRIPNHVFSYWGAAASVLVGVIVAAWAIGLTIGAAIATGWAIIDFLSFEWLYSMGQGAPPSGTEPLPPLGAVASSFAHLYVLYLAVFFLLLPGLLLHEFSHLVALRKHAWGVEKYGLVFIGPLPVGAFVKPNSGGWIPNQEHREVYAVGPIANIAWATILAGSALLLDAWGGISGDVVFLLQILASGEILLTAINAGPATGSDGVQYVRLLYSDWWGFPEGLREVSLYR